MEKETQNVPEYLYHYTDVDSFALILKNRTIRFNALDKMDDRQEQFSTDKQNFGKFVLVSSWTDSCKEDIPMWRMYTPKGRGVRIKLHSNPFRVYAVNPLDFAKVVSMQNPTVVGENNLKTIIPFSKMIEENFCVANFMPDSQLDQVQYTDDEKKLNPTVYTIDNNRFDVALSLLGIHKSTYWAFQKEWRYRLLFISLSIKDVMRQAFYNQPQIEMATYQKLIRDGEASLPFSYYDLVIEDAPFEKMEVTLAPDISESARMTVELLVREFNPSCTIRESALAGLIQ